MDEYISRNELLKVVQSNVAEAHNERCGQLLDAILNAPTADVVPKSEVERLKHQLEIIADEGEYWQGKFLVARSTVAREIFEEIEKDGKYAISFVENHKSYSEEVRQAKLECYKDIQTYIAELKKKYTESEGKE